MDKRPTIPGPDKFDDGVQVVRLHLYRPLQLLQRGLDGSALGVPKHYDQPSAELLSRKLHAADERRSNNIARDSNDKKIAEA